MAGRDEHRDHLAVQERPRRFAVHQQHGCGIGGALVQVVHAEAGTTLTIGDLDVVRFEREVGQRVEPIVGCA
jgi:hypothetical protein